MITFDYRGVEIQISKQDLMALKTGIEELDRQPPPVTSEVADFLVFIRQIATEQASIDLNDEEHESLKIFCARIDLDQGLASEDSFTLATARILQQLKTLSTISCGRCGCQNFSGRFFSRFSESDWLTAEKWEPVEGDFRSLSDAAEDLIMRILDNLNQEDVEVEDYVGSVRISSDVSEEVSCSSCSEPLELPDDAFPDEARDPQVPYAETRGWDRRISWGEEESLEGDSPCDFPDRAAVACPACNVGQINLFAQRMRVEHSAGKQSGMIEFKEASSLDTQEVWDTRLIAESTNIQASGQEDYPAEVGYRVGMRCSRACWEVRGIRQPSDVPSALVAICALAKSSKHESHDAASLELLHMVTALQLDIAEQEALLGRARDWIDSSEFNPEAMEGARQLLVHETVKAEIDADGLTTLVGHPELNDTITDLYISNPEQLANFEGLEKCTNLRSIGTTLPMPALQDLDGLSGCKRLSVVHLDDCPRLHSIDGLKECALLVELSIEGSERLVTVDALNRCEHLTHVELTNFPALSDIDALAGCKALTSLGISGPAVEKSWSLIAALPSLTSLTLGGEGIVTIEALRDCPRLTKLSLISCINLRDFEAIGSCVELESLSLFGCSGLMGVTALAPCKRLKRLSLWGCSQLRDIEGLGELEELEWLDLSGCTSLQAIEPIAECTSLRSITLSNCTSLESVDALANCRKLTGVYLFGCTAIQNIDALKNVPNVHR